MNLQQRLKLMFSMILMTATSTVIAGSYQDHASIYQAATEFVRSDVLSKQNKNAEVISGKLDSRLKLNKCEKNLQAFLPKGSRNTGKTTIGVKCEDSKPWSLHIPVAINIYRDVLVASRQLQKGSILKNSDTRLKKHNIASLQYGFFESSKSGVGQKLKRRVSAGTVLTPSMLKQPQVISRGQKITILARSGLMEVRTEGKALENGAVGERIQVINVKSKQKLEAVIVSSGTVKVDI